RQRLEARSRIKVHRAPLVWRRLSVRHRQPGPLSSAQPRNADEAEVDDLDLPVRLKMTELPLVPGLEVGADRSSVPFLHRDLQRPLLTRVAEIEGPLESQIGRREAARRQTAPGKRHKLGKGALNCISAVVIERLQPGLQKILANVGPTHAKST